LKIFQNGGTIQDVGFLSFQKFGKNQLNDFHKKYSYFLEKIKGWREIQMAAKNQDGVG
jgi:hypothetical protein